MGTDTVPAMLTPGEFVVKASSVTPETLPILKQMNEGYIRGPETETVQVPRTRMSGSEVKAIDPSFRGSKPSYEIKGTSGLYVGNITDPAIVDKYPRFAKDGMITREMINKALEADVPGKQLPAEVMLAGIAARTSPYRSTTEQFLYELAEQGQITKADARMASNDIHNFYERTIKSKAILSDKSNPFYGASNAVLKAKFGHNANLMNLWEQFSSSIGGHTAVTAPGARRSGTTARVLSLNALDGSKVKISKLQGNSSTTMVHGSTPGPLLNRIGAAGITRSISRALPFVFSRGRIRMANGGMVPNVQYMEDGSDGPVRPSFSSGFQAARNKPSGGGGMSAMGSTGMFMGGMGLSMAGSAVGGTAGTVMNSAGMAMQFLPMLSGLKSVMGGLTKVTALAKTFGSIAGTIFRVAGTAVKFFTGPVGLAVLGITALVQVFKLWRKGIEDTRKEQTALYGMSEKGAKELGINYVNLSDKIKSVREEQKLAADKAKAYFESYTAVGGGLTLTLKQLKELKERVKTDMPETLEILNNIDSSKINDWASNLKAQMIASGKTVEETTNLIYALIESSNKAGMGINAITSKTFNAITGQASAAALITKNLAENFDKVNEIDGEAFASNLDTAVISVENAIAALVGTKDAQGEVIDQAEALSMIYKEMSNSKTKDKKITEDVLKVIQKQRPELAAILNQSDTIGSMIAKWRLHLSGVAMDLKNVTAEQAEMMAQFQAGLEVAGQSALDASNNLSGVPKLASTLKQVTDAQAAASKIAEKAGKGQLGANKTLLKQYQDEIKLIRERAEAKKKALRETFDKENAELELQKAKLDLQNAVARGDNEAAAAAQIRIQQIQKEVSLRAAETKIDENAKKEESKQQALYDAEKAKDDSASKIGSSKGNQATALGSTAANIRALGNRYTGLGAQLAQTEMFPKDSDEYKKGMADVKLNFSNFMKDLIDSANKDPFVAKAFENLLKKDSKTGKYIEDPGFRLPKRGMVGSAFNDLESLAGSMTDFSAKLMGGPNGTLTQVIKTLEKGFKISAGKPSVEISSSQVQSALEKNQPKGSQYLTNPSSRLTKEGYLQEGVKTALLADKSIGFEVDKIYEIEGFKYRVSKDYKGDRTLVRQKATGGSVIGSTPYLVGERGPELFVPSAGGQIIPNNIMGAKYNIPNGSISGVNSMSNASSNNIVYNIDIDLNGTNVTADDIMRKFKSELALIGAKEGRVRTLGGNY
jgi:hypothetical protein